MAITLQSFALDRWVEPSSGLVDIPSAVDGHIVARASSAGLDFKAMVRYAREVGGLNGKLKGGRHLAYPTKTIPTGNLLLSVLDKFGIHQDSIGDSTGELSI